MRLSIIIPVYNSERFIEETLQNVTDIIPRETEILIVDDGSTDQTANIIKGLDYPFSYFYKENGGPSSARNFGLRQCSGEYIGFIDSDDLWPKDKLSRQLCYLENNQNVDLIWGKTLPFGLKVHKKKSIFSAYLGAALFKRYVFDKIGDFGEDLLFGEDIDLYLRVKEAGLNMLLEEEIGLYYRHHLNNSTNNITLRNAYTVKWLKKKLDRKNASNYRHNGRL